MYTYKTLVRDNLVDKAGFKTLFAAAATGSCRCNMEHLRTSAVYPQVLIGYGGGETHAGLDAEEGRIYLTIECQGTGTTHAHKEIGKFRSEILTAINDMELRSTAVCYHIKKFSEVEGYDDQKKMYWSRLGFDCEFKENFNRP